MDTRSSKLKGIIEPEHLLQAIENVLEHSEEMDHGVTGLTFKRYTITVGKKPGLSWSVECRFRRGTPTSAFSEQKLESTMPTTTKKTIVAAIVQKAGLKPAEAKRALETVLGSMKRALADGKKLDLGRLGVLSVVTRSPARRINRNLKNVGPTIETLHRRHPKTVRHTKGQDLSENPQPTIVHKRPEPPAKKSFAIALPAWRRRIK